MTHIDDPERIEFYRGILQQPEPPTTDLIDERQRRLLTMLAWDLGSGSTAYSSLDDYYLALWLEEAPRQELLELLELLDEQSTTRSRLSALAPEVPLVPHARYTRSDVLAALAVGTGPKPPPSREGLTSTSDDRYDAFFVDLQKAERDYSPTTMYRDYAINRELFHWESQSTQTPQQPRVRRWIEHQHRGGNILLFVRDKRRSELGTQPFTFLGPRDVRRSPRGAAGRVHVAPAGPDARRALRGRPERRGGVAPGSRRRPPLGDRRRPG